MTSGDQKSKRGRWVAAGIVGLVLAVLLLPVPLTVTYIWQQCSPPSQTGTQKGMPICIQPPPIALFQPTAEAQGIPKEILQLYIAAGQRFNVPWPIIAGIGKMECDHGQSQLPGCHSGANFAGAEGPMQFLPGTFAKYGVAAPGHTSPNIYDPADAVYSAANYLGASGATGVTDLASPRIYAAIWAYNHLTSYVLSVIDWARKYSMAAASAGGNVFGVLGQASRLLAPLFSWVPKGGFPGTRFYQGFEDQCTYYAAYQWPGRSGSGVTWSGNATDWIRMAMGQGFQVSSTPSVGAIAVWGAQSGYSGFGHVAIVKSVQSGSYTVSEQNYQGAGVIDERTIPWPDTRSAGFIPIPGGLPGG
jgi:CHAP domain/Transglycosylase SLT domain